MDRHCVWVVQDLLQLKAIGLHVYDEGLLLKNIFCSHTDDSRMDKLHHFFNNHSNYRNPCGETMLAATVVNHLAKKFDIVFVDGGYNKGAYTSMILKHSNPARVLAYELSKQTYDRHSPQIKQQARIELFHRGLFKENVTVTLQETVADDKSYSLYNDSPGGATLNQVQLVRLDDHIAELFLEDSQYLIVKLDVEGAEFDAIMGMSKLLEERTLMLQWEMHSSHGHVTPSLSTFIEHLTDRDFFVFILGNEGLLRIDNDYSPYFDPTFDSPDSPVPRIIGKKASLAMESQPGRPNCINCVAIKRHIFNELASEDVCRFIV